MNGYQRGSAVAAQLWPNARTSPDHLKRVKAAMAVRSGRARAGSHSVGHSATPSASPASSGTATIWMRRTAVTCRSDTPA